MSEELRAALDAVLSEHDPEGTGFARFGGDALLRDVRAALGPHPMSGEELRAALQEIIDLPTVIPDHPHGGVYPPYLEWTRVAAIARAALAAPSTPEPSGLPDAAWEPALNVERLRAALYNAAIRHTWSNVAAVELATEVAAEYARLAESQR